MAVDGRDFLAASRGELSEERAAGLGRELARSAGHDADAGLSRAEWAAYARQGSRSLLAGKGLSRPAHAETGPERTERPEPVARVPVGTPRTPATRSSRPSGPSFSAPSLLRLPSLGAGPVGRLIAAGLAGAVTLQLLSLMTKQYFTLNIPPTAGAGGGAAPPNSSAHEAAPSPAPVLELYGAAA